MFRTRFALALLAVVALTVGACTASQTGSSPQASAQAPTPGAATPEPATSEEPTESAGDDSGSGDYPLTAASGDVGPYLTGEGGMTLYTFTNDTQNSGKSVCNDDCAANWPPYVLEGDDELTPGDGVSGTVTMVTRDDGTTRSPTTAGRSTTTPRTRRRATRPATRRVASGSSPRRRPATPLPDPDGVQAQQHRPRSNSAGGDSRPPGGSRPTNSAVPRRITPSATLLRAADRAPVTTTDRPILGRPAELATEPAGRVAVSEKATEAAPAITIGSLFRGIHPVLFGVYPILFLWSQNVGETGPDEVGDVLAATFLAALVITAIAWVAFQDRARGALFVAPILLGFLLYGHIANVGIPEQTHHAAWIAVLAITLVAALKLPDRWIDRVDGALRVVAVVLVAVTLVNILPTEVAEATTPQVIVADGQTLPGTTTAAKRDVYWLVYDRYGSDDAFETGYGVKNDLTPWFGTRASRSSTTATRTTSGPRCRSRRR